MRRLGSHHRCAGRRRRRQRQRRWWRRRRRRRWRSGSGDGGGRELHLALSGVLLRGGDTLLVLGVLHTVTNPMGYQTKACTDSFAGTSSCYLEEEVLKKVELYKSRLLDSAEKCKEVGATMRVKIIAGTPTKMVILQEVFSSKASWVILDRHLRRDYKILREAYTLQCCINSRQFICGIAEAISHKCLE